ncbi:ABC transporter permease [Desertibaculum subflavum]|uniref:ABC transporter permease n=1 Tax=Desertibaculum subflavum TaxID=2268458 RepID=UPI000E66D213
MVDLAQPGVVSPPRWMERLGRIGRNYPPLVLFGMVWLAAMLFIAITCDWISPYAYAQIDLRARLAPPVFLGGSERHLLGTDELGRDVLARLFHSIRMSLMVALIGTAIGATLGTLIGFLAAHFRGLVDDLVMTLIDFQASMPFMIIALAVLAFFGNDLVLFICLMGIFGWERYARIVRGMTLSASQHGYAVAVRQLGAGPFTIYGRHILPNIASTLIVNLTLNFPEHILLETGLSFLGLGVQPPLTSLGNMVGYGRDYLQSAWWIAVFPGLAIVLTTLSMSLVGDWLRDRLDPTLR